MKRHYATKKTNDSGPHAPFSVVCEKPCSPHRCPVIKWKIKLQLCQGGVCSILDRCGNKVRLRK
jgi:hypothetical protein